jgi:predicted secreted protein
MYKALGTLLKRAGTTILEVGDITGPALKVGTMDTTSHSSTGGWREFITTIKEGGQVTFPINYDPAAATHGIAGLLDDFIDGTLKAFTVTFTDTGGTIWDFYAYVIGFIPSMPVEGKLSATVTLLISGAVTIR